MHIIILSMKAEEYFNYYCIHGQDLLSVLNLNPTDKPYRNDCTLVPQNKLHGALMATRSCTQNGIMVSVMDVLFCEMNMEKIS